MESVKQIMIRVATKQVEDFKATKPQFSCRAEMTTWNAMLWELEVFLSILKGERTERPSVNPWNKS